MSGKLGHLVVCPLSKINYLFMRQEFLTVASNQSFETISSFLEPGVAPASQLGSSASDSRASGSSSSDFRARFWEVVKIKKSPRFVDQ